MNRLTAMLFNWKFEGADIVMDWVAVLGVLSAIVLLIIEIVKTTREKSFLSKEDANLKETLSVKHDGLSKEHTGLSTEHTGLSKEHASMHETNRQILHKVTAIDKFVAVEAERRSASQNMLSEGQREIRHQVEAISNLYREMERLQIENTTLRTDKQSLQLENQMLRNQIQQLSQQQDSIQAEFDEGINLNLS